MPSVAFWPAVGGGTEHYRCRAPGGALSRAGWDVTIVDAEHPIVDADIVVFQRVGHADVVEAIRHLQARGSTVIYDIDDWYDNIPDYNPAGKQIATVLTNVHDAMAAADLITCSTVELAEAYARFGPTVILPNYLDPDLWSEAEMTKYRGVMGTYRPGGKIHVGWAGHVDYRSVDLDLLKPWLPAWLDRNPDVVFVGCGGRGILDYLEVGGLASPPTPQGGGFRPYDHLPALLTWLDVGLVPLVYNRFNESKSWCKGLEYGAASAACVASPSREYRKYVRPGVNGYLVRKNAWATTLDRTLDNLDDLKVGARRVAEEHMIDRHIGRWVDAYTGARHLIDA